MLFVTIGLDTRAPKMKHSHAMISNLNQRRSKLFMNLNRKKLRVLTMFLTGHGVFKAHLKKVGLLQETECRKKIVQIFNRTSIHHIHKPLIIISQTNSLDKHFIDENKLSLLHYG